MNFFSEGGCGGRHSCCCGQVWWGLTRIHRLMLWSRGLQSANHLRFNQPFLLLQAADLLIAALADEGIPAVGFAVAFRGYLPVVLLQYLALVSLKRVLHSAFQSGHLDRLPSVCSRTVYRQVHIDRRKWDVFSA